LGLGLKSERQRDGETDRHRNIETESASLASGRVAICCRKWKAAALLELGLRNYRNAAMLTRLRSAGQLSISISSFASGQQPVVVGKSSVAAVPRRSSSSSSPGSSPLASSQTSSSFSSSVASSSCRNPGVQFSASSRSSCSCAASSSSVVSTGDLGRRLLRFQRSEFPDSLCAQYSAAAAAMEFEKIKVDNPIVEMDGKIQTITFRALNQQQNCNNVACI
jgi:hypothetical protein